MNASVETAPLPDMKVSVRQVFGIDEPVKGESRIDAGRNEIGINLVAIGEHDSFRFTIFDKNFRDARLRADFDSRFPRRVGERELMAAMVATWNSCAFCVGAHGAVAAKELQRPAVDAVLADFRTAPISDALEPTLTFLEIMTLRPAALTAEAHAASQGR